MIALCGCESATAPALSQTPEPQILTPLRNAGAPSAKPFASLHPGGSTHAGSDAKTQPRPPRGDPAARHARIVAVGDIMFMAHQIRAAKVDGGYDFFPAFEHIEPYINTADIAIANLETPVAGEDMGFSVSGETLEDGTKTLSYFNAPVELLDALKLAGFNVLTTANNHALDKEAEGLRRTIENIRAAGIHQTGTFLSGDERYLMLDANGVSVAVLAYTSGTNKLTGGLSSSERHEAINLINKQRILDNIASARKDGAELVILCLHWGVEFSESPTTDQERQAKDYIAAGADVLVGSHPHVLHKIDKLEAGGRTGIVAYSMGNFISNMTSDEHSRGVVLTIDVEKGEALTIRASYLPTLCKTVAGQRSVLPAAPSSIDGLNESTAQMERDLRAAYEKSAAIIGNDIVAAG